MALVRLRTAWRRPGGLTERLSCRGGRRDGAGAVAGGLTRAKKSSTGLNITSTCPRAQRPDLGGALGHSRIWAEEVACGSTRGSRSVMSAYWVIRLFCSAFTRLSLQKVQFEP